MKFHIVVRPQAELEILEAVEYYESERSGLGIEFLYSLEGAKEKLIKHPQFYLNIGPSAMQRRFLLDRFPYIIVYEINNEEVIVIAVRHTKRKPLK